MSATRGQKIHSDAGLSLTEILIYTALMVVVVIIVSSLFTSLFRVQSTVANGAQATAGGQLIANSIEGGVRNATAVSVATVNTTDQLVLARTAGVGTAKTWTCSAWYFDAIKHEVRFFNSSTATASPGPAQLATWQLLGTKVYPQSGSALFSLLGSRLSLSFKSMVTTTSAVPFQTSVSVEGGSWTSAPCF